MQRPAGKVVFCHGARTHRGTGTSVHSQSFPALAAGVLFASQTASPEALAETLAPHLKHAAANDGYSLLWHSQRATHALHVGTKGQTTVAATFGVGGFALHVAVGTPVAWGAAQDTFVLDASAGTITFNNGSDTETIRESIVIPADAQTGGTFRVPLKSAATSLSDASIRFFYPGADGVVRGLTYPVFARTPARSMPVVAWFDPAHPEVSRSAGLQLAGNDLLVTNFLTSSGQRLQLASFGKDAGTTTAYDPATNSYYQTPVGQWRIVGPTARPPAGQTAQVSVLGGLSGLEFMQLEPDGILEFHPESPAYAPGFTGPTSSEAFVTECPGNLTAVQTSWASITPHAKDSAAAYYSQPLASGLFQPSSMTASLLLSVPLKNVSLPPSPKAPVRFPMAPYAAIKPGKSQPKFTEFESLLSSKRSNQLFELASEHGADPPGPTGANGANTVTPQGLLSTFSGNDKQFWTGLVVATSKSDNSQQDVLGISGPAPRLRAALLSAQTFLVISKPAEFEHWAARVGFSALNLSGWTFNLNLTEWRNDTVLIFKFAGKPLSALINNLSLWTAPGSKINDGAGTQKILVDWMKEAEEHRDQPEFAYFLKLLNDPNWNGVLFANVKVPPSTSLPPEIRALSIGIDASRFKAHHLGVARSPFYSDPKTKSIHLTPSSLFGLISYDDASHLVYSSAPYDFKVTSLRVLFSNTEMVSFTSRIELLVAQLFGERSSLRNSTQGDNLILVGVMQTHDGERTYTFTGEGTNSFALAGDVLQQVRITRTQMITLPPKKDSQTKAVRFVMNGALRFLPNENFDIFTFGPTSAVDQDGPEGLRFSNMFVGMEYGVSGPSGPSQQLIRDFAFDAGQMSFDLASSSSPRPDSLYARFPLHLNAMQQGGKGTTPASLGFMTVDTPLDSQALGDTWFGLQMGLDLGSAGALAAQAGISINTLAAWSPGITGSATLGLQLPGSDGDKSLVIQGSVKLTLEQIAVSRDQHDGGFLMRFANIVLQLFSLKFPPSGTTNLLLFRNPDAKANDNTLGWYAAYQKTPPKKDPAAPALAAPELSLPAFTNSSDTTSDGGAA